MAGATIYQLELSPISDDAMMTEATAYDTPFYNNIADYVYEVDDRASIEQYLADSLIRINNKDRELVTVNRNEEGHIQSITFRKGFREAYFAASYAGFMKLLAQMLASTTLSLFAEGQLSMPLHTLNTAYDDEYGDYVCTNEYEFYTFDEFIRASLVDIPYYLGGIMSYHY